MHDLMEPLLRRFNESKELWSDKDTTGRLDIQTSQVK